MLFNSLALIVRVPFPFCVWAGCGIRLYRQFLNTAFSFSYSRRNKHLVSICTRKKAWVPSFLNERIVILFYSIEILLDCKRVENKNNIGTVIGKMKSFLDKII